MSDKALLITYLTMFAAGALYIVGCFIWSIISERPGRAGLGSVDMPNSAPGWRETLAGEAGYHGVPASTAEGTRPVDRASLLEQWDRINAHIVQHIQQHTAGMNVEQYARYTELYRQRETIEMQLTESARG
jgi:hypothetical protein